jgi:hypothetical protein
MRERLGVRLVVSAAVACLAIVVSAGPAAAQPRRPDDVVVLTGGADVAGDEAVGDVVVFDGGAVIRGSVDGSVVSFNGDVTVTGEVADEVVVFRGKATIRDGARVGGDIRTVERAQVEEGAEVRGSVGRINRVDFEDFAPFAFASRIAWWIAVSVSTLLLGVLLLWLAPRAAAAVAERTSIGGAIGWGLLLAVGLPILAVLALITIVGIPFGLGLMSALLAIYGVGYVTACWLLGNRVLQRNPSKYVVFLAGWAILRLLALIPILGGLISVIATIVGLGALASTRRAVPEDRPAAVAARA